MARDDEVEKRRLPPRFKDVAALANLNTDGIRAQHNDDDDDKGWMSRISADIAKAMMMKKNMIRKGIRVAKAHCPHDDCNGFWHGRLAGRKNHIHIRCDGGCQFTMME